MKMIRIGVHLTGKHLTYIQSFESSFNALYLFQCVNLQSLGSQRIAHFLRCQVKVNVLFQPFI